MMWFKNDEGIYMSEESLLDFASKAGLTGIDAYRYMLRLNLKALEPVKMDFCGGTGRYYDNKPVNDVIGHTEDGYEIYAECLLPDDEEVDEDYGYMRMIKMLMIYCNDKLGMDVYLEGCKPYDPESPEACIGDRITIYIDDGWDGLKEEV